MQIDDLTQRLYESQKGVCFICEKPIDIQLHEYEIDHIIPRAEGGKDDDFNKALVHRTCNRQKLDSDLRVARCMAKYEDIKNRYAQEGPNRPNLGDFLKEFGGAKYDLRMRVNLNKNVVEYTLAEIENSIRETPLYKDKLSNLDYFFIELPIEYIHHDDRINPRAVGSRIRGLINEFLLGRPQLHVSLAWAKADEGRARVQIFDGQHKAVAQILLGVKRLPIRVFLNPDLDLLLVTNTNAGTTLRQIAFDKAVQRLLGSKIYWEKIDEYRRLHNLEKDDLSFSEKDLVQFFRGQHREMKKYILDDVRAAVLNSMENKLKDYIEFGGRATEKPLSYSSIEKTFYSFFIHKELMNIPLDFKLEVGENPRQLEKDQLIMLMNIVAEEIFIGKYDFDIGTNRIEQKLREGEISIPDPHLRAVRMAREEVLYNWLRYVRDLIKRFFLMQGQVIEEEDLFQKKFPPQLWDLIRKLVRNIANLPIWVNREESISSAVFGGKQTYDFWKTIFETGKTPAGMQILPKGLNLDELVK